MIGNLAIMKCEENWKMSIDANNGLSWCEKREWDTLNGDENILALMEWDTDRAVVLPPFHIPEHQVVTLRFRKFGYFPIEEQITLSPVARTIFQIEPIEDGEKVAVG